ncbi:unnamed protein product, partial [Didymodactylos carnosus]
ELNNMKLFKKIKNLVLIINPKTLLVDDIKKLIKLFGNVNRLKLDGLYGFTYNEKLVMILTELIINLHNLNLLYFDRYYRRSNNELEKIQSLSIFNGRQCEIKLHHHLLMIWL